MKNLVLVLVLFITCNMSFANDTITDCWDYAVQSTAAEEDAFGSFTMSEHYEAFMFYLGSCQSGGEPLDPIFLN